MTTITHNTKLPSDVENLVFDVLTEHRNPQWIETDDELRVVRSFGAELVKHLDSGSDLSEALPCVVGAEAVAPIVFPIVNLDASHAVDVHIFHKDHGFQVLLLDSSQKIASRQPEQQQSNEVALLNHQLTRMTRELEAARRQAEEASAAKSRFIAGMSHELRTPLTSILGFSDLMVRGVAADHECAQSINESASYLLGLVDNLLEHGSVEQGSIRVSPEPVDLETFFESFQRLAEPLAERKGLLFELRGLPSPANTWAEIDPLRFRQILFNLVTNAVRYTESGSITLDWSLSTGRLQVTVTDTGPGIAASDIERIFLPFTRRSDTQHRHGLGLGLSISRKIAEAMGGELTVATQEGAGSAFTVSVRAAGLTAPIELETRSEAITSEHPRVLIVDDDPNIRAVLELALEEQGYEVDTCADLAQARTKMDEKLPDVALVDLDLYGQDGLEVVDEIRRRAPGIPALAMSAAMADQTRHRATDRGCVGFIEKPFDFIAVGDALSASLQQASDDR